MVEPLRPALAVSVLAHAAVLGLALLLTVHRAGTRAPAEAGASFRGETYDLDELLETRKPVPPAPAPAPAPLAPAAAAGPDPG